VKKRAILVGVVLPLLMVTGIARADSWVLPTERSVTSDDGRWRLTITPRTLTSQLDYFTDSDAGKHKAGGIPSGADSASGRMHRREGERWIEVWSALLLNDVSPVEVLVSHDGLAMTLDNWHSMGYGDTAIVIYDGVGQPKCQWSLDDLLPISHVDNLPRSVSSIAWRGNVSIEEKTDRLRIPVAMPIDMSDRAGPRDVERALEHPEFVTLEIDVRTCAVSPPEQGQWARAIASAAAAQKNRELDRQDWRAMFHAPLLAPTGADEDAWLRYLAQARLRAVDIEDVYASADDVVLVPADVSDEADHPRNLRSRLSDNPTDDSTLIVGSPSQQALVEAITNAAKNASPGKLAGMTIVLVVDDEHHAKAAMALAASGARLVQVDPSKPLPQSAFNLARFEKEERERISEHRERELRIPRHPRWWLSLDARIDRP